jgi:SAM-dependent methyltransferase
MTIEPAQPLGFQSSDDRMRRSAEPDQESWEAAVAWLRGQPDQQDIVVASYYDDPLSAAAERYWRSEEWREISKLIGDRQGRALDVGAGRGIASYALARAGFAVTALEPDPSALVGAEAIRTLADEQKLSIDILEQMSAPLPLEDEIFDLVFARAVLHHIHDLPVAMREFRRVLKPGGLFIAVREHVISRKADLPRFLAAHPLHFRYGGEHAYLLEEYVEAIQDSGLTLSHVLAPLETPINYAPHSRASLHGEIVARLPGPMRPVLKALLKSQAIERRLLRMMQLVDHRPGRHYSFVARR